MTEKELSQICLRLKSITLKPIIFNDIKLELLDVKRAKHPPGTTYFRHHHPWFEFNYFISGVFKTEILGKSFVCSDGDALLIPPGVSHSQVSGSDGDDGICMRWRISAAYRDVSESTRVFLENINRACPESLDVDMSPLLSMGEGSRLNCAAFLHFVLSVCDRRRANPSARKPKRLISNQVIMYMEEYLQNPITATDVADALNMSYRNLARIFKKETGVSIIEKLSELRITEAQRLLKETDMSVSKIAEAVGLVNVYYFSNMFKKYTRMSPKAYRKEAIEEAKTNI